MNQNHQPRSRDARLSAWVVLTLVYACFLFLPIRPSFGDGLEQSRAKLDRLIQASSPGETAKKAGPADAATEAFRAGRDLIADEEWVKAEEKFNQVIVQYRTSKYVDAAMYWLAFTLKKQGKFKVADAALERLIKTYPKSTWINDARAMRVEIAPRLGKGDMIAEEASSANNDEIRVVALQSLFQANPERAMTFVVDILKPESKASRRLKESAIMLIGQSSGRLTTSKRCPCSPTSFATNQTRNCAPKRFTSWAICRDGVTMSTCWTC